MCEQCNGLSSFDLAIINGAYEVVKYLYSEFPELLKKLNQRGNMPLHEASIAGRLDMFKFLMNKGADPQDKNQRGVTPLELAKTHQQNAIIDYLKENFDKLY